MSEIGPAFTADVLSVLRSPTAGDKPPHVLFADLEHRLSMSIASILPLKWQSPVSPASMNDSASCFGLGQLQTLILQAFISQKLTRQDYRQWGRRSPHRIHKFPGSGENLGCSAHHYLLSRFDRGGQRPPAPSLADIISPPTLARGIIASFASPLVI